MGMKQLVRFMPIRFYQKLLIDCFYFRVFMRLSDGHAGIFHIDCLHALLPDINICWDRLTAAADTSAGAGHDLNEMV